MREAHLCHGLVSVARLVTKEGQPNDGNAVVRRLLVTTPVSLPFQYFALQSLGTAASDQDCRHPDSLKENARPLLSGT